MSVLNLSSNAVYKPMQTLYWLGGSLVILLAATSFFTQMTVADMLSLIERLFGVSFVLVFSILVSVASYSVYKIHQKQRPMLWAEVGLQAANGISTLALTFTLLGISLGIGSLASQPLSAETVQGIIGELTAQFSTAFMTTVVGLPTATLFRGIIGVQCVKQQCEINEKHSGEKTHNDLISEHEAPNAHTHLHNKVQEHNT